MNTTAMMNYSTEEYASGELRYNGSRVDGVVVTMLAPVGNITSTPLVTDSSQRLLSDNVTVPHTYTTDMVSNDTDARLSLTNFTLKYANNSTLHFRTQVSMTTDVMRCCATANGTTANSTNTEMNSDDALGPVIAGLCTAVGLLLCLWLICFAIEKRIHSRKRAVERHYLPQSRSYPIQVAEMRKALRPTANGFPGSSIRICKSAPTIAVTSFHGNASCTSSDAEDDNFTSDNLSEDSVIKLEFKPNRRYLTVGDPYTYTPLGVHEEETITSDGPQASSSCELQIENESKKDTGASNSSEDVGATASGSGACSAATKQQVPGLQVPGYQVPGLQVPGLQVPGLQVPGLQVEQTPGLRLQLEIDESQCVRR